jgi:hypothetical protein
MIATDFDIHNSATSSRKQSPSFFSLFVFSKIRVYDTALIAVAFLQRSVE